MLVSLEMHVDPAKFREMLRYALPFGDEAVRHTRTEYDDKAMRGVRAFVDSDPMWDWLENDVWPASQMEAEETVSAEEAEAEEPAPDERKPLAYVPAESAVLAYARDNADDPRFQEMADRAHFASKEEFVEYLPYIITLMKVLIAWSKRNR